MGAEPVEPIEVGVYDAKTHLSRLLDEVALGRIIAITRHGKPAALLSPAPEAEPPARRAFGGWEDYVLRDGWDDFTEEDQRDWYGEAGVGALVAAAKMNDGPIGEESGA